VIGTDPLDVIKVTGLQPKSENALICYELSSKKRLLSILVRVGDNLRVGKDSLEGCYVSHIVEAVLGYAGLGHQLLRGDVQWSFVT